MHLLRGPVTAFLCATLASPYTPGWAEPAQSQGPAHPARTPYKSTQIQGDLRILQALNRLTFGPRPGDVEAVRALGLERWFDQQLHPAGLDESLLNARLGQYPAMRLSSEDLLARLPSNAIIRQANDGKVAVPERGLERAVYEDQMYRVAVRKDEKQKQDQASAVGSGTGTAPAEMARGNKIDRNQNSALARLQDSLDSPDGDKPSSGMSMAAPATASAPALADTTLVSTVIALPPAQRVARVASLQPADADAFFKAVKGPDRAALNAGLSAEQKEAMSALENPQRTVVDEVVAERLTRDIYASAQLQEVMTDFWFNHFNVFLHKNEATPYYLVSYERDVIRPRALGKFEDLLEATAHSPAMLQYLDNASSTGPDSPAAQRARMNAMRNPAAARKAPEGLNENYARELMELHTLGVNGGYTQADVTQVARILTGWTIDRPQRGGGFRFDENRHEPGNKKVMGKKFKEDGEREGRDLLHFLATRPATARFLSRKLAVRFVSDDPPASLVDRMAHTYLSSGGDIAAVLKTMFHSPEFWSNDVVRAKVKTPLEYVVSSIRAANADVTNMQPLANALRDMGMPVYGAVPPTGYKWDASDWVSTGALVTRMNFALTLAAGRLPGIATQWSIKTPDTSRDGQGRDPQDEEARLESLLIPGGVSISTRSAVLEQFATQSTNANQPQKEEAQPVKVASHTKPQGRGSAVAPPSALERQDQVLAGLLLGSPEFQRR
jgi:uncharacterized protein (DUF1800 family)